MGEVIISIYLIISIFVVLIHSLYFLVRDTITKGDILIFIFFPLSLITIISVHLIWWLLKNINKSKITKWLQEPLRKE
ncbi:hypothetical protein DVV91_09980 [Clostridium botulinum]|nr:hypothetical protein [Clostridium botulinum]